MNDARTIDPAAESARIAAIPPAPPAPPPPPVPEVHEDDVEGASANLPSCLSRLYIDCYPVQMEMMPLMLSELVELNSWARTVAADLGVVHYGIADFRKGARGIAAHLDEYVRRGPPGWSGGRDRHPDRLCGRVPRRARAARWPRRAADRVIR